MSTGRDIKVKSVVKRKLSSYYRNESEKKALRLLRGVDYLYTRGATSARLVSGGGGGDVDEEDNLSPKL